MPALAAPRTLVERLPVAATIRVDYQLDLLSSYQSHDATQNRCLIVSLGSLSFVAWDAIEPFSNVLSTVCPASGLSVPSSGSGPQRSCNVPTTLGDRLNHARRFSRPRVGLTLSTSSNLLLAADHPRTPYPTRHH